MLSIRDKRRYRRHLKGIEDIGLSVSWGYDIEEGYCVRVTFKDKKRLWSQYSNYALTINREFEPEINRGILSLKILCRAIRMSFKIYAATQPRQNLGELLAFYRRLMSMMTINDVLETA